MNHTAAVRLGSQIVWRNKWLYLLALLPALSGILYVAISFASSAPTDPATITSPDAVAALLGGWLATACLVNVAALALAPVNLAARGGLIAGVDAIDQGEVYGIGRAFRAGGRKVLSLLTMTLILYGLFLALTLVLLAAMLPPAILAVMGSPPGLHAPEPSQLLSLGVIGCLGVLIVVTAFLIVATHAFAFRGIVLRDMGAAGGIRHGWHVLRDNLADTLLLALPFLLLAITLTYPFASGYAALVFPSGDNPSAVSTIGLSEPTFLALSVVFALVWTALATWQSATFTLAYIHWTSRDGWPAVPPLPADPLPN